MFWCPVNTASKIKNITAKEFVNITYNTLKIFTIRKKDNNFIEFACHINVIKHTFELHLRYKRRLKFFVQSNLHDFYKGRYLNDALNMMKDLMNEKDISDI